MGLDLFYALKLVIVKAVTIVLEDVVTIKCMLSINVCVLIVFSFVHI